MNERDEQMRTRCLAAFLRRMKTTADLCSSFPAHNRIRVFHYPSNAWMLFDISSHRIRALEWNFPERRR